MKNIKDLNIMKDVGIKRLDDRECETCGEPVPVYERNGETISTCLNCVTNQTKEDNIPNYDPPKRRTLKRLIRQIHKIPSELEDVTFQDYIPGTPTQKEAYNDVVSFVKGEQQSLLFQGKSGIGKSHLFRCAVREIAKQTIPYTEDGRTYQVKTTVLFAKVPELMKLIQQTYNRNTDITEQEIIQALTEVDVLVLDEVGGERTKKEKGEFETWTGDIIYQVVDQRQDKRNLYNTNYKSKQLQEKYGEVQGMRIVSRMANGAKALRVEGEDKRIKGIE